MSWQTVRTDEDIKCLMDVTGDFLDCTILSMNYLTPSKWFTDCYGEKRSSEGKLLMTIHSHICGDIQMLFISTKYFTIFNDSIEGCHLKFRTPLDGKRSDSKELVLSDWKFDAQYYHKNVSFSSNTMPENIVISDHMKWRFADEAGEFDCLDEDYAPFCE